MRRLVVEFASPNVHHKLLHSETKSHCNSHTFDQLETSEKNPLEILKINPLKNAPFTAAESRNASAGRPIDTLEKEKELIDRRAFCRLVESNLS